MKKLFIVIAILLLAGAGYFTYDKWMKDSDLTSWSFVPSDAAMVFELELLQDYSTISGYPVWNTLKQTTGFSNIDEGINFLDSINGKGGFRAIFKDAPVLISAHKVSSEDMDFLYVLDIQNISQNTFVGATIGRLKENGFRFKTRNYNGFSISEISKDNSVFTCIFYKNYLLASFTPYLVEDAIRTISDDQLVSYKEKFVSLEETQMDGLLNMYINYQQADNLLSVTVKDPVTFPLQHGNFTARIDSGFISLSGFSYPSDGWFSTHKYEPAGFDMAEIVPENTAFIYHISTSQMSSWKSDQMNYLRTSEPLIKQFQDSLKSSLDFNADQIFDLIDEEIGIVTLESGSLREDNRLCILEVKDMNETLDFFRSLTERIAISRGDSVYTENYSDNEIRFLPVQNFPQIFLGKMAGAFEQTFYISYRNYLIFSNNLQELKSLISSIDNEDTWGKSLRMTEFMNRTNNTSNVSLFVNLPRAWNMINEELRDSWASHFKVNMRSYKSFELAAFQFNYSDDRFFTNFTFTQPELRSKNIPKTNAETGVRFVSSLITKPFLLRTHVHKDFDILVQDSTNTVYYLDKNQNAQWSHNVESPIISDIFPIDYYRNGKIQYAFATNKEIHILDRIGESIPGFPKSLPGEKQIDHFNLIDYDLSRNYRMAITDVDGDIYLTDKDVNLLEGWNPKELERKAITPLKHARLGRSDIMISVHENGDINITNRRGEFMRGFPFKTRQTLDKNYYLRPSNGLGNSSLTVISKRGDLTEMTLEGDVIRRDQLIKTQADASFQLVPDRGGKSFLIVRKEGNQYDVLDDTGNLLFQKDYLSEEPILIQYYQFGAGKDLVIFTDTANKSLYIYDKTGNLVTGNPLNSANEVSVIYSSTRREFQVFTTWGSNLELYSFNY